jgi:hypothetical protein
MRIPLRKPVCGSSPGLEAFWPRSTEAMIAKMNDAAPGFGLIAESFRRFDIAARLTDVAEPPHKEAVIDALRCPGFLMQCHRVMYVFHAKELIARVTSGEAIKANGDLCYSVLGLATKPELMFHLSLATAASRLVSDVEGLYEKLFCEVFGSDYFFKVTKERMPRAPSHPTAYDELLTELRHKCRVERDRPPEPTPEERQQKVLDESLEAISASTP